VQIACGSPPDQLGIKNLYALAYVCLGILGLGFFLIYIKLYFKRSLIIEDLINNKYVITSKEFTV